MEDFMRVISDGLGSMMSDAFCRSANIEAVLDVRMDLLSVCDLRPENYLSDKATAAATSRLHLSLSDGIAEHPITSCACVHTLLRTFEFVATSTSKYSILWSHGHKVQSARL